MDPKTPTPATDQPADGLIMPEPQVTPAPAAEPAVTPEPVVAPEPVVDPAPAPVAVPAESTPPTPIPAMTPPAPAPSMDAVSAAPVSAPEPDPAPLPDPAPVEPAVAPEPVPVIAAVETPALEPFPEAAPAEIEPVEAPEVEADPLFAPVTEADPLDAVPETVAPTPAAPVTDQAMDKLDDGPQPVVASTGQTVIAASKPTKSRRKTMIILVVGLLLAGAAGFAAYTFLAKPNVSETTTPSAIVAVDQLSPEGLTQATDKADLTAGSQTNASVLLFSGKAPADAPVGVELQIEIQPLGTDFTGTPTEPSIAVPDETNPLQLKVTDYEPGSYHWRARLSDGASNGPWVAFNTDEDAGKTADFTIDRTAPSAALIKTLNNKNVTTKTVTSTVAKPVFTGTSEAGSTVTVAFNESLTYKAVVAADGSWTLTTVADVPNAKYTLTVTSADAAGNATASSYTFTQSAR